MERRDFLKGAALAGTIPTTQRDLLELGSAPATGSESWVPLFNGRNLDGWYSFLQTSGKNRDPKGSVRVEEGMIHILGSEVTAEEAESGYLATDREFGDCRIRAEYKWGTKRFPPRSEQKRDSGLLHHIVGPDRVWPTCVEFQVQESDTGDIIMLGGVRGKPGEPRAGLVAWPDQNADLTPTPRLPGRGRENRVVKTADFEDMNGWNVIELVMEGNKTAHIVNGRLVNSLFDIEHPIQNSQSEFQQLTRGKIALEIEWAEIWFRKVEMKTLR